LEVHASTAQKRCVATAPNRRSSDLTAHAPSTTGRRQIVRRDTRTCVDSHAGTTGSATTPPAPSSPAACSRGWYHGRRNRNATHSIWACDDRHIPRGRAPNKSQLPYGVPSCGHSSPCTTPWNLAPEPPGCRGRARGDRQQPLPPGRARPRAPGARATHPRVSPPTVSPARSPAVAVAVAVGGRSSRHGASWHRPGAKRPNRQVHAPRSKGWRHAPAARPRPVV